LTIQTNDKMVRYILEFDAVETKYIDKDGKELYSGLEPYRQLENIFNNLRMDREAQIKTLQNREEIQDASKKMLYDSLDGMLQKLETINKQLEDLDRSHKDKYSHVAGILEGLIYRVEQLEKKNK